MKKKQRRRRISDPAEWLTIGAGAEAEPIQVIGTPEQFMSGAEPTMRPMRLEDLEDDCELCQMNRARIQAGDPPMVLAFD